MTFKEYIEKKYKVQFSTDQLSTGRYDLDYWTFCMFQPQIEEHYKKTGKIK